MASQGERGEKEAGREVGADVVIVAVCRGCGGWVAVMTEDMAARGGDGYRDIMRTVAKLDLRLERMPGDDYRAGKVEVCHRYRDLGRKKAAPRKVAEQTEALL